MNTHNSIFVFAQTSNDTLQSSLNGTSSLQGNNVTSPILPSWNDEIVKERIINFVKNITDPNNSNNYIPPQDRIAVFDNDGTLWSEKPIPFQGFFALDRLEELYNNNNNNELKNNSLMLVNKFLNKNISNLNELTEKDIMDIFLFTHSNISQTEFDKDVVDWSIKARHPETKTLFVDMVYQPLLELLDYLRANEFKIFIVSGGGVDFMRQALSSVYDIPPEQIIGSSIKYEYIDQINANESTDVKYNGTSFILRKAELNTFNNDYEKPANIQLHIGKVPVIAVGNSDGDLQMLEYSFENNEDGQSLPILIHHDDEKREYSYDKGAENALKDAQENNWLVVSMKNDFKKIYP
ncbi:MAG: HAD family hydrolase [Nitrososphaeraceae archaeon]